MERPAAERSQGVPPSTQHLPLDQSSANWIFQVVSRRYEKKSLVLTTNLAFSAWPTIFPNATCATALIDRVVHHADVIAIKGESYRAREAEISAEARRSKKTKADTEDDTPGA